MAVQAAAGRLSFEKQVQYEHYLTQALRIGKHYLQTEPMLLML
jgi:hypothetical protein